MPLDLITLPLRIGLRVAGIVLRTVGLLDEHEQQTPAPPVPVARPARPRPREPEPTSRADVPEEPPHVSEEPVLVAEVADEGAEDSPGPQISVAEPWDGYAKMKAADVVDRLAAATAEELAVVQLYESTHKRRKTVLQAAGYSQRK